MIQVHVGFLVHLQQRAQLLVECRFGHHRPAIAQSECETIQRPLLAIHLDGAQVSPVHLRLLTRRCFEAAQPDRLSSDQSFNIRVHDAVTGGQLVSVDRTLRDVTIP